MDDLNQGLLRDDMIMMGGGNPAAIPAAIKVFEDVIDKLQASGGLVKSLANYDGPQGKDAFLETLADFYRSRLQIL